ncbi:MD-2-related lipid-recognition protein [Drosophila grimshawi]|uniref:MD-2-related lipid-recognition protein n=1 Tax=Drosophila grimshawi TaxID=7222 RepID=UPI000C871457|nr:MD-2-related lipid-recognition protein [Drosophila grimshawi]
MLQLGSLSLLLLLLLAVVCHADVIQYQMCPDSVDVCSIDEVRVDPCPQAATNTPCRLRRRHPSRISFDFTPKFDAEHLVSSLGWAKSETEELPLLTLERDSCKNTQCPVKANVQQTYAIDVPIDAKFPMSTYTIRWALKDEVSSKRCCFTIVIKVVR